jgi:hypothetical protein
MIREEMTTTRSPRRRIRQTIKRKPKKSPRETTTRSRKRRIRKTIKWRVKKRIRRTLDGEEGRADVAM